MEHGDSKPAGGGKFFVSLLVGPLIVGVGIYLVLLALGKFDPEKINQSEMKSVGGIRYKLVIDETPDGAAVSEADKEAALDSLRQRFELHNLEGIWVERDGNDRIFIDVPTSAGAVDIAKITRSAKLNFKMAHPDYIAHMMADVNDPPIVPGADLVPFADDPTRTMLVRSKIEISGDEIKRASATNGFGSWQILISLNKAGAGSLYELSKLHNAATGTGLPFAIILDGEILSAPAFNEPIAGGSAQISGDFTEAEARSLAAAMMTPIGFAFKVLGQEPIAPAP